MRHRPMLPVKSEAHEQYVAQRVQAGNSRVTDSHAVMHVVSAREAGPGVSKPW